MSSTVGNNFQMVTCSKVLAAQILQLPIAAQIDQIRFNFSPLRKIWNSELLTWLTGPKFNALRNIESVYKRALPSFVAPNEIYCVDSMIV
jgi:hypothetical protein